MRPQTNPRKFPLFKHSGGQWCKKVAGRHYYFGPWRDDLDGKRALADWLVRESGIKAGLDRLRVVHTPAGITLGELMGKFLDNRRTKYLEHYLSPTTYRDYLNEIHAFTDVVGAAASVAAMKPEHFGAYAKHLTTARTLSRHSRKRIIAYIKAMFHWGAKMDLFPRPCFGEEFTAPRTSPDALRKARAIEGKTDYSRRIVSGEEVDKILAWFTRNPQFKAIVLVGINCGLGPADIGRLRWRNINMETGELNMPRGKTGTERKGYLWKKTREALENVKGLKHNELAIEKDGEDALVFVSRTGKAMYREEGEIAVEGQAVGVKIHQAITITFRRCVRDLKIAGVSFYRLRHTFKTLGKKAKDRDALNLMMGHREGTMGEVYDHEDIKLSRLKKVAITVFRQLWPKKREAGKQTPTMRVVG